MSRGIYCKEHFVMYSKQQIIVNDDAIKAFQIIREVMRKLDGRIANARIKTLCNSELDKAFKQAFLSLGNTYSTGLYATLYIRDHDNYTTRIHDDGQGRTVNYVEYQFSFNIYLIESRIDALNTIKDIDATMAGILATSKNLSCEIDNIDKIESEYKAIKQSIKEYNEKYSYIVRDVFNVGNEY